MARYILAISIESGFYREYHTEDHSTGEKARQRLARQYDKVANLRRDVTHKLTSLATDV